MQIRNLILLTALLFIPFTLTAESVPEDAKAGYDWQMIGNKRVPMSPELKEKYKEKINENLEEKIKVFSKALHTMPVINTLLEANEENQHKNTTDIEQIDEIWALGDDSNPLVVQVTRNDCSKELIKLMRERAYFAEIFVTDARGMNVCQTNMTSDYYQADEDWWQNAFAGGMGKASKGELEFDKSSGKYSYPIFVPVTDPESKEVIGVGKAILLMDVIQ